MPRWRDTATGDGVGYVRNGRSVLLVALDLLLIGASIVLIAGASLEGFWWKRVAAADGDVGSTVPIPPRERPTPRISNGTALETATPLGVFIDLTLADLGLRILPEAGPLAGQQVVFPFPFGPESGITWQAAPEPGGGGVLLVLRGQAPRLGLVVQHELDGIHLPDRGFSTTGSRSHGAPLSS